MFGKTAFISVSFNHLKYFIYYKINNQVFYYFDLLSKLTLQTYSIKILFYNILFIKIKILSIFGIFLQMDHNKRHSQTIKTINQQPRPQSTYAQRRLSKDVCKSINIFPIKIQNQNLPNQRERPFNQTLKNFNTTSTLQSNKQNNKRKSHLLLKSKHSIKLQNYEQLKVLFENTDQIKTQAKIPAKNIKRSSLSFTNTLSTNDEDSQKLFQMLHKKKDLMMLDHSRLVIQTSKFKQILNQFQSQIRQIKTDRDELSQKVNKYEYYFKQMKLKHIPTNEEQQNVQKNQQLKILNLQKKVQTLNYIIKQYRTNNNQQIKSFEQKLKDFKPNIEKELTQKLAQTNQKYEKLLKKVQFFQKQCKKNVQINWQDLMAQFQETKLSNEKNMQYISQLSEKLSQLKIIMGQNQSKIKVFQKLQDEVVEQKQKIQKLTDMKLQLQDQILQKDRKIDQLNHLYEQTSFKVQGLKNLQFRIQNKDKTIKKNTIVINRLQCENIQLKSKIDTVLGQFQSRIFCQKTLQQSLLKANSSIQDLTNRLHQTFIDFCQNSNNNLESAKQKQYFIGHLFEKVKISYNQIISQYQNQLKLINSQCQTWKQTFDMISKNQQQKFKYIQKTQFDLMRIEEKKIRCQQSFNRLSNEAIDLGKLQRKKQCHNCQHLIAYWGQLENSYCQMKIILQKMLRTQSLNPVTVSCKKIESKKQVSDEIYDQFSSQKSVCILSIPCI